MFMVNSMKKMLRQTFSVFEPEQGQEMGNYKYRFDRNYIIFWLIELVCFLFCFFWYLHPDYSKFCCVTIVNREMKSVSAI